MPCEMKRDCSPTGSATSVTRLMRSTTGPLRTPSPPTEWPKLAGKVCMMPYESLKITSTVDADGRCLCPSGAEVVTQEVIGDGVETLSAVKLWAPSLLTKNGELGQPPTLPW